MKNFTVAMLMAPLTLGLALDAAAQQRPTTPRELSARRRARCGRNYALDIGFADQSHFTKTFRQLVGITPGDFRARFATHS